MRQRRRDAYERAAYGLIKASSVGTRKTKILNFFEVHSKLTAITRRRSQLRSDFEFRLASYYFALARETFGIEVIEEEMRCQCAAVE